MKQKDTEKILFDSLFIAEGRPDNTLVDVPDVRGWISPFKHSYANRIGLADGVGSVDIEKAITGVIDFFKSRNSGFTWIVGSPDIEAHLPEKLLNHGLTPSRFHKVAGMCLESPFIPQARNQEISVREITGDEIIANIEVITHAYGDKSVEYTQYLYALHDNVRSRMYLAYLQDTGDPVGYGYCSYIENNSILVLRGAAVVPEHRGKGIYQELLNARISDACNEGIKKFVIQSARDSSYSACCRFGFKEICPLELYQWSPS